MNKRFDELMYHAGLTAQGCWESMDEYDRQSIMKFGELIVRDCLRQIYGKSLMANPEYKWSPDETAYNEGIFAAYDQVKKHFGVK